VRPFFFAEPLPPAPFVVSIGANSSLEETMVEPARLEEGVLKHAMFADSLLDTSWTRHARRGCTTLTSFGLQAVMISLLLLMPLLRTVVLPASRAVSTPISMGRPAPTPLVERPRSRGNTGASDSSASPRFLPSGRLRKADAADVGDSSSSSSAEINCTELCNPSIGDSGGGLPISITGTRPMLPLAPAPTLHTFRTSKMLEGSLYHRVQPVYPSLARAARIQGEVVLAATISKAGMIENLQVLRGHPMLVRAALDAVSQWRYRPYILNNEPVEVETQITVNFILSGD